jgi:hypothetical protein
MYWITPYINLQIKPLQNASPQMRKTRADKISHLNIIHYSLHMYMVARYYIH